MLIIDPNELQAGLEEVGFKVYSSEPLVNIHELGTGWMGQLQSHCVTCIKERKKNMSDWLWCN